MSSPLKSKSVAAWRRGWGTPPTRSLKPNRAAPSTVPRIADGSEGVMLDVQLALRRADEVLTEMQQRLDVHERAIEDSRAAGAPDEIANEHREKVDRCRADMGRVGELRSKLKLAATISLDRPETSAVLGELHELASHVRLHY